MKKLNLIWGVIFISIMIIILFGGAIYLISTITEVIGQIIVAAISLFATIFAALLSNYQTKKNQLEFEMQKEKSINYKELVSNLSKYIREPNENNDLIATINFNSWIYGSPDVIKCTRQFMVTFKDNKKEKQDKISDLKALLISIRLDLGKNDFNPEDSLIDGILDKKSPGSV